MKELLNKLSKAKQEIKPIFKSETNPFFKSKYFDINALLDQIEPILHSHGLLLVQPIESNKVVTKIYDIETGQHLESSMALPELNDPQKMGSATTYYRRYTLQSALALQAEDDDGNASRYKKVESVLVNKPDLTPDNKNWAKAKEAVQTGTATLETIRKNWTITDENYQNLCL